MIRRYSAYIEVVTLTEASLIPVISNIVKVEFDDGPDGREDIRFACVFEKPVGVCDHRSGPQSGAIFKFRKLASCVARRAESAHPVEA